MTREEFRSLQAQNAQILEQLARFIGGEQTDNGMPAEARQKRARAHDSDSEGEFPTDEVGNNEGLSQKRAKKSFETMDVDEQVDLLVSNPVGYSCALDTSVTYCK